MPIKSMIYRSATRFQVAKINRTCSETTPWMVTLYDKDVELGFVARKSLTSAQGVARGFCAEKTTLPGDVVWKRGKK